MNPIVQVKLDNAVVAEFQFACGDRVINAENPDKADTIYTIESMQFDARGCYYNLIDENNPTAPPVYAAECFLMRA